MHQALHIFRKDVRYLWREISMVALLAAMLAAIRPDWIDFVLFPAAIYLIARLVHAEAIAGDRQFWITRPYRWQSLVGAKLLFLLTFVNLPILLAQWWIVATGGFPISSYLPNLLLTQLWMILSVTLPVAALAAVTSGFVSFTFSFLILGAMWMAFPINQHSWPLSIGWIRVLFATLCLTGVAVGILYVQYRGRKTLLSRAVGAGGLVLIIAAAWVAPWITGWALQSRLSKQEIDNSLLQISADPTSVRFQPVGGRTWSNVDAYISIAVAPIPSGVQLKNDALSVTFAAADGTMSQSELGGVRTRAEKDGRMLLDITSKISQQFYKRERDKQMTIRGSLYMTLFGNPRAKTIPLRDEPVNSLDALQCNLGFLEQFQCRSAFRWPRGLVYANMSPLYGMISYAPIPLSLKLDPLETHWAPSTPQSSGDVTVVVQEPIAHIRRDFEMRGVRIHDLH